MIVRCAHIQKVSFTIEEGVDLTIQLGPTLGFNWLGRCRVENREIAAYHLILPAITEQFMQTNTNSHKN